jgi:hypothetical protein
MRAVLKRGDRVSYSFDGSKWEDGIFEKEYPAFYLIKHQETSWEYMVCINKGALICGDHMLEVKRGKRCRQIRCRSLWMEIFYENG